MESNHQLRRIPMIIKKDIGNAIVIYSDEKKKIIQKQTQLVFSVAYENKNGMHYEYEEIED